MKNIIGIIVAFFLAGAAVAQPVGQLPSGTVWGNSTAARAPASAATITGLIDRAISGTQGAVMTRDASAWIGLAPGTAGLPLLSGGAAANLAYGIPALAAGGTGANLTASTGGIVYSGASALAILSGTATAQRMLQSGASSAPGWSTSTYPATSAAGTILASGSANTISATSTPTLGVPGTTLGSLAMAGNTSGTVTITPQAAAGSPTLTLPNTSGTFAVVASSPLALSATTGTLTCSTCVTGTSGAITAGTTTTSGFTAGQALYSNGTTVQAASVTGTLGSFVLSVGPTLTGSPVISSTSAAALSVGANGATNPALLVDASTASSATGISVKSAAAAGGAALAVISSGTNENLTINAKGSGTISIGSVSTGAIALTRATTMSAALTYGGVTLSNSVTGTGSMVLSAAPTLTGTTIANAIAVGGATLGSNALAVTGPANFSTDVTAGGSFTAGSSNSFNWSSRSQITSTVDGNILVRNNAGTGFGLFQLGGATTSFPAIKRNGAGIDLRLADDSAYALLTAGQGNFTGNLSVVSTTATPAGGTAGTGLLLGSGQVGLYFGSGAPTLSAAQGSIYMRSDGVPYYNTNGTTGWDTLVGATATQTLTNKSIVATQLTGTLQAGQFPALTGDVTTSAGALATTIANSAVSNAKMANAAAYTLKGNATGSSAALQDFTITGLTVKASPVAGDYVLVSDGAASGALKKVDVTSIASAGSVSSIAGNTGAFTLSTGITNSGNDIRLDRGQLPGSTTNDNASAGNIGEYASIDNGGGTSGTATITIATPAVITWTHSITVVGNIPACVPIYFTTTGALPTNLTASTIYWAHVVTSSTLNVSTSAANCLAGTYIATSGSQSGTHTAHTNALSLTTDTGFTYAAMALSGGNWDVTASSSVGGGTGAATTTVSYLVNTVSLTSSINQSGNCYNKLASLGSVTPYAASGEFVIPAGPCHKPVSGTTNVFGVIQSGFTSTSDVNSIAIRAIRTR